MSNYIYKAPLGGYYSIRTKMTKYVPTGEYETVLNYKWRWWKPWVPKMVIQEIYKAVDGDDVDEIRYYDEGANIYAPGYRL